MKKLSEGDHSGAVYLQLLRWNLFTNSNLEAENGLLGLWSSAKRRLRRFLRGLCTANKLREVRIRFS